MLNNPTARRRIYLVIALLGLVFAASGIWFEGLRTELRAEAALAQMPLPNKTPFFRVADSFYWVAYARDMIDNGKWRARFTEMDNAPYGRPNLGWASLNAWYLVGLTKAWTLFSPTLMKEALSVAALWSNPILYLGFLISILIAGIRLKNFPAAAVAVFVLGTSPRVYDDFAYAVPGHHGWHDIVCFTTLVSLGIAVRKRNAKRWFAYAGISAACAIWIGATQQIFGLAAAGLGAIVAMLTTAHEDVDLAPESWRWFGISAAIGATFFYLIEYAPAFAMHLEINHPIYAVAFLCGGEFLCRGQRLISSPDENSLWNWLGLILTGAVLFGIAAMIFLGPTDWHTMRQPFIRRVHHEIIEFQSVVHIFQGASALMLGLPILLAVGSLGIVWRQRMFFRNRMAILVCAFPCVVAIALSFLQLRWAGIAAAAAAALAAVVFADERRAPISVSNKIDNFFGQNFWRPALLFASLGLIAVWTVRQSRNDDSAVKGTVLDHLATLELASALQSDSAGEKRIAVFSNQKERQAWINFTSNIHSVGALYWDNPIGLRDEAQFFATYDDDAAHQIAQARGINYIVTTPRAESVLIYHYLLYGSENSPEISRSLAYRLAAPTPNPPSWLELLPITTPAISREGIRIYRVL